MDARRRCHDKVHVRGPRPEDPAPLASSVATFQPPPCRPQEPGAGTPQGALGMEAVHELCMSVAGRSRRDRVSSLRAGLVTAHSQAIPRGCPVGTVSLLLPHRGGCRYVR